MDKEIGADEVRELVLWDHTRLRAQLAQVDRALKWRDRVAITWTMSVLLQNLRAHLELEDRVLEPVLRRIDAWGAVRAERLLAEHAAQRAEIDALALLIGADCCSYVTLSARVGKFTEALTRDMALEEQGVLAADLLTDYPTARDAFGG